MMPLWKTSTLAGLPALILLLSTLTACEPVQEPWVREEGSPFAEERDRPYEMQMHLRTRLAQTQQDR